jgi:hypothetical protein
LEQIREYFRGFQPGSIRLNTTDPACPRWIGGGDDAEVDDAPSGRGDDVFDDERFMTGTCFNVELVGERGPGDWLLATTRFAVEVATPTVAEVLVAAEAEFRSLYAANSMDFATGAKLTATDLPPFSARAVSLTDDKASWATTNDFQVSRTGLAADGLAVDLTTQPSDASSAATSASASVSDADLAHAAVASVPVVLKVAFAPAIGSEWPVPEVHAPRSNSVASSSRDRASSSGSDGSVGVLADAEGRPELSWATAPASFPDCDVCGDDPATKYCGGCTRNVFYCDDCFAPPHSKPKNTDHCAVDVHVHLDAAAAVAATPSTLPNEPIVRNDFEPATKDEIKTTHKATPANDDVADQRGSATAGSDRGGAFAADTPPTTTSAVDFIKVICRPATSLDTVSEAIQGLLALPEADVADSALVATLLAGIASEPPCSGTEPLRTVAAARALLMTMQPRTGLSANAPFARVFASAGGLLVLMKRIAQPEVCDMERAAVVRCVDVVVSSNLVPDTLLSLTAEMLGVLATDGDTHAASAQAAMKVLAKVHP